MDNSRKDSKETHVRVAYGEKKSSLNLWLERLGFERSFVGKAFFWLEEHFEIRKISLICVFSLLLAALLKFEYQMPANFKMGEVATRDYVSPLTFEMVDEVTTEEKRKKAEAAVPIIFDFDSKVYQRTSEQTYRSFRTLRQKYRMTRWSKQEGRREEQIKDFLSNKFEFEKLIGTEVPDYTFEWLTQVGFSARIENALNQQLSIWSQLRTVENLTKNIPNSTSVILARTVSSNSGEDSLTSDGREFYLRRNQIYDVLDEEVFTLDEKAVARLNSNERRQLLDLARRLVRPNLTLNKNEIAERRSSAREAVLPITLSIKKNQNLINEGSIVQPFQMALIKEIETLTSERRKDIAILGLAFLFVCLIIVFSQYFKRFSLTKVFLSDKDWLVMASLVMLQVLLTKGVLFLTQGAFTASFGSDIPSHLLLYAAPLAAAPMVLSLLIPAGEVVWIFVAFLSIVLGFMTEMNFMVMIITFIAGIAAARGVYSCKRRADLYKAGFRTGVVQALAIMMFSVVVHWEQTTFLSQLTFGAICGLVGGVLSAMVALMLIPIIENMFNYTTDVKLMELSSLNHPLLKEMIVKAPGTYHHSMMVGSMVEAAAEEIGANSLLARVMSYYHDIGKMVHPNYFIENQKVGQNPHDHISPYMSKTLLVAHVKDGVDLGSKYKLGGPILDGVVQHHGTTLISFFYNKALDLKADGDPEIPEEEFRYPGPKPQFREAALCMLADSIEAAGRSLDEPTPARLQNIVRNIVQRKFMDGQLDECNLSLKDLSRVENAFIRILLGIYHQRIDYPKSAGGKLGDQQSKSISSATVKS